MRFGGHETFSVREGWLHKGINLLIEDPDRIVEEFAGDWLGVGGNMAKSIRHWLVATGLAEGVYSKKSKQKMSLQATSLGKLIAKRDPYFLELGTWWALHVNLVNTKEHALSWHWFFNAFNGSRFERSVCLESLRRYLELSRERMPSPKTLERDLGCLLNTYARKIPETNEDPEDARESPFLELGLMNHFRSSGYYQLNQGPKEIAPEILGYALATAFEEARKKGNTVDIPLDEATRNIGGPGRAFVLTSDALFEVAVLAEEESEGDITIVGHAGRRMIRVRRQQPLVWLTNLYKRIKRREKHAA